MNRTQANSYISQNCIILFFADFIKNSTKFFHPQLVDEVLANRPALSDWGIHNVRYPPSAYFSVRCFRKRAYFFFIHLG